MCSYSGYRYFCICSNIFCFLIFIMFPSCPIHYIKVEPNRNNSVVLARFYVMAQLFDRRFVHTCMRAWAHCTDTCTRISNHTHVWAIGCVHAEHIFMCIYAFEGIHHHSPTFPTIPPFPSSWELRHQFCAVLASVQRQFKGSN